MDEDIYTWLFEAYAQPELAALEAGQDEALSQFAARLSLPRKTRRRLLDLIENIRLQWGAESFALGVRFGTALAAPHSPDADCRWLLEFLPQLDHPVS